MRAKVASPTTESSICELVPFFGFCPFEFFMTVPQHRSVVQVADFDGVHTGSTLIPNDLLLPAHAGNSRARHCPRLSRCTTRRAPWCRACRLARRPGRAPTPLDHPRSRCRSIRTVTAPRRLAQIHTSTLQIRNIETQAPGAPFTPPQWRPRALHSLPRRRR